ncbi:MAG: trigger factor, partial [Christensenellales bacterium]
MNYIKENAENNRVKFTFTFDGAEFEAAVEKAYQQNKGKYSHEGFRKGKVPRKVLEGFYGKSLFFEDAINLLIPENYGKALDENPDVIPVDRPDFDIAELDDEKLVLTAVVTVEPKIELGQYKGLKLAKKEYTVSEDDVKAELDRALDRAGRLVDVDRPAEKGDTLILDYSGSIDGVKFDGGTAEKQNLVLGSNMFIPGFEDQLIGVKAGESRDVKVQFPANYGAENLAGKDAVFACTVHQVKVKELPALDDEFAKDVSDFDTLEAYKEDIKKNLQTANDRRAEQEAENDMIEAIVSDIKVDSIPDCMIDSQTDDLIKQFEYRLMYQGMKLDDYLKYAGITMEQMRKDYRETAEKNV